MSGNYQGLSIPQLYLLCVRKGIKDYFAKTKEETIKLLNNFDSTVNTNQKEENMAKKKVIEADDDLLLDDDELEEVEEMDDELEELEEDDSEEDDSEEDAEEEAEDEEDDDLLEDESEEAEEADDDELEDLDDLEEVEEVVTKPKKGGKVAKKAPAKKATEVAKKAPVKAAVVAKKAPVKAAVVAKAEPTKKASVEMVEGNPFRPNTAGHFLFEAMIKGGSLEVVCERAEKRIEKAGVKPPANTSQKLKIIMAEVNSGKRGAVGSFEVSAKGKLVFTEA